MLRSAAPCLSVCAFLHTVYVAALAQQFCLPFLQGFGPLLQRGVYAVAPILCLPIEIDNATTLLTHHVARNKPRVTFRLRGAPRTTSRNWKTTQAGDVRPDKPCVTINAYSVP